MIYRNAYDATGKLDPDKIITEKEFNLLQVAFAKDYIASIHYQERLQLHRNPQSVMQETLNEIYRYLQEIQRRKETVDSDVEKNVTGNIVSKVGWIWQENKTLRSLYNAILAYCKLRDKDPNLIATHIAEYKSLSRLARLLESRINKKRKAKEEFFHIPTHQSPPPTVITEVDRLLREIDIIQAIFESQSYKANNEIDFVYPNILDADGLVRTDGVYLNWMDIFSVHELFPVQQYKKYLTERFESAANTDLIRNQLQKIYEKAKYTRDYYNNNLIKDNPNNPIVNVFLETHAATDFMKRMTLVRTHSAVVTIKDYRIDIIYMGTDRHTIADNFVHRREYVFNYMLNNYELARVCQHVIDFIELFNLPITKKEKSNPKSKFSFSTLEQVFITQEKYQTAIRALREVGGIDDAMNNICRNELKGIIQVWILLLRKKNYTTFIKDGALTTMLNKTFKGLDLGENTDGRTLRNISKRANAKYHDRLNQLL